MDSDKAIVLIMAAGAASIFRPNAFYEERSVESAYATLGSYLADHYPAVTHDILDIGPASAERQTLLATQLRESGAAVDPAVLAAAALLAKVILDRDPDAAEAVFVAPADLQQAFDAINTQLEKKTE
ncbi:MAG: hypothetical protein KA170_02330 [Candidatus Promineofilum sp.]|nr:hypothetical protein [Promineifilum sp.]